MRAIYVLVGAVLVTILSWDHVQWWRASKDQGSGVTKPREAISPDEEIGTASIPPADNLHKTSRARQRRGQRHQLDHPASTISHETIRRVCEPETSAPDAHGLQYETPLTPENLTKDRSQPAVDRRAQFRYGVVFVLTLALVVFVIAAPNANWSRAVALAIEGVALVFAVATGRERQAVRDRRAIGVAVMMIALIILVATGSAPPELTEAANAIITAAIPVAIVGGVLRLMRERGATLQAVAGALAIYLAVGLVFAWIIGFITHVDSTPYFAQHTNGTEGDRVYFSFAVLTTTGFGDFSAATPVGHALAVIEELTGQLYLVTVIGL